MLNSNREKRRAKSGMQNVLGGKRYKIFNDISVVGEGYKTSPIFKLGVFTNKWAIYVCKTIRKFDT
jgi:hypothetical protein